MKYCTKEKPGYELVSHNDSGVSWSVKLTSVPRTLFRTSNVGGACSNPKYIFSSINCT